MFALSVLYTHAGDGLQDIVRCCQFVAQQPAAHNGPGPPDAAPAVNIDRLSQGQGLVDVVQNCGHEFRRGDRDIRNRKPHAVDGVGSCQFLCGLLVAGKRLVIVINLVFLHQVDDTTHAGIHEQLDILAMSFGVRCAGKSPGQKLPGDHPVRSKY